MVHPAHKHPLTEAQRDHKSQSVHTHTLLTQTQVCIYSMHFYLRVYVCVFTLGGLDVSTMSNIWFCIIGDLRASSMTSNSEVK